MNETTTNETTKFNEDVKEKKSSTKEMKMELRMEQQTENDQEISDRINSDHISEEKFKGLKKGGKKMMKDQMIYFKKNNEYAILPERILENALVFDVFACLRDVSYLTSYNQNNYLSSKNIGKWKVTPGMLEDETGEDEIIWSVRLNSFERIVVPLGFDIYCPKDYSVYFFNHPVASKTKGFVVINNYNEVKEDFMPNCHVLLTNFSSVSEYLVHGEKIARMVIAKNSITDGIGVIER